MGRKFKKATIQSSYGIKHDIITIIVSLVGYCGVVVIIF